MLVEFFEKLRRARIPVSITEFLALLEALQKRVAGFDIEEFYFLARAILVKDERHFDRFDIVFSAHFKGAVELFDEIAGELPEEWLRKQAELLLSEEEKREIEALGGWDKLMETLRERLEEQQKRHQGGSKWIGTAGTSPFGAYGFNPEGIRMGQEGSRNQRAVKVWDRRDFRNLDDDLTLGTRNLQVALRKLRKFAREGAEEELDLDGTIRSTARNAGFLDIKLVPERHNAAKVLLFFDVGGSMYPYIRSCEELFSAARSEFKHLEYFYFHNFFYDHVWRDNRRRHNEKLPLVDVLRTYGREYKVIIIGDATMSPYEISVPGGCVEYWNEEPGEVWMGRLLSAFPRVVWLNPVPVNHWPYTMSVQFISKMLEGRMFPLSVEGLERCIQCLKGQPVGLYADKTRGTNGEAFRH
ncbi:VWA domain-containing protein [Pseudomonadota bacterium]